MSENKIEELVEKYAEKEKICILICEASQSICKFWKYMATDDWKSGIQLERMPRKIKLVGEAKDSLLRLAECKYEGKQLKAEADNLKKILEELNDL